MEEKKIATSVDILINVDRFEHLQITKYSEKKITYESKEEMIQKEDELTDEVVKDMIRTMNSMPAKFCTTVAEKKDKIVTTVAAINDKIAKKIPSWLEGDSIPNIANTAQKNTNKAIAEEHAKQEDIKQETKEQKAVSEADTASFLSGTPEVAKPVESSTKGEINLDEDLFADSSDDDLFKC